MSGGGSSRCFTTGRKSTLEIFPCCQGTGSAATHQHEQYCTVSALGMELLSTEQQEAKASRVIMHVIFAVRRLQRPLCKRAFLISLGLVAIAVPSMANESATGMADTCA
jgi:hypothetical protein